MGLLVRFSRGGASKKTRDDRQTSVISNCCQGSA